MPILTSEAIQENPWNVMSYELPEKPSRFLLLVAQIAATCCRQIAEETLHETGEDVEEPWLRPAYSEALDQWSEANGKIGEICFLLEDEFDVPVHDFYLSRNSRKGMTMFEKCKTFLWRGGG